jgi:FAD/FMN-containing dehydrogenase
MTTLFWITALLVVFATSNAAPNGTTTPEGCRKLKSDTDWPTLAAWKAAVPGVTAGNAGPQGPDYRIQAKDFADVQNAVKFATKNNIRVTIITTGHDQIGRSDSSSGLLIDLTKLNGINVLESFTPTPKGAESPKSNKANIITPKLGVQAAATIGPAVSTQQLNDGLSSSKLLSMGATHGMSRMRIYVSFD